MSDWCWNGFAVLGSAGVDSDSLWNRYGFDGCDEIMIELFWAIFRVSRSGILFIGQRVAQ